MTVQIVPNSVTVADYCNALSRGEIRVNPKYQRSNRVWPAMARSFLIETILLGYPMPKLALHQVTDLKSRKTIKEVVDGQQRSKAILDFFKNELRLSRALETPEVAGRTYDELEPETQGRFLDYPLNFDLFVAATEDDVREVFRRMNSFTVPLNPEEQRHAVYQGEFKWFIHRLSRRFDQALVAIGGFSTQQIVRMADMKLLTEICHAALHGISTTSRRKLDDLYKARDHALPEKDRLETAISGALELILEWEEIRGTAIVKPYMLYGLVLGIMHLTDPFEALEPSFPGGRGIVSRELVVENLSFLAEAVETEDPGFAEFVAASSSRTNVGKQREIRFQWFCRALSEPTFP